MTFGNYLLGRSPMSDPFSTPPGARETNVIGLQQVMVPFVGDIDRWGESAADWDVTLLEKNAFRVRGVSWYKRTVAKTASDAVTHIPAMRLALIDQTEWRATQFNWDESIADAQIFKAFRTELLRFDKAAQVLLACITAARAKGQTLATTLN